MTHITNLPKDVLNLISERYLPNPGDHYAFLRTCKTIRAATQNSLKKKLLPTIKNWCVFLIEREKERLDVIQRFDVFSMFNPGYYGVDMFSIRNNAMTQKTEKINNYSILQDTICKLQTFDQIYDLMINLSDRVNIESTKFLLSVSKQSSHATRLYYALICLLREILNGNFHEEYKKEVDATHDKFKKLYDQWQADANDIIPEPSYELCGLFYKRQLLGDFDFHDTHRDNDMEDKAPTFIKYSKKRCGTDVLQAIHLIQLFYKNDNNRITFDFRFPLEFQRYYPALYIAETYKENIETFSAACQQFVAKQEKTAASTVVRP